MSPAKKTPSQPSIDDITFPVEIRFARCAYASFAVKPEAAAKVLSDASLDPKVFPGGMAIASIAAVEYVDGDLGPYHEVALSLLVEHPDASGNGKFGAFIRQLPVNQPYTMMIGRGVWGFPKEVTDIDIDFLSGGAARAELRYNDVMALRMTVGRGISMPSRPSAVDAYSFLDGVRRRTSWSLEASGTRMRPAGAKVEVGEGHPFVDDLRTLGFPKRSLAGGTVARISMSFGPPKEV